MRRRINSTQRQRITNNRIEVKVTPGEIQTFQLEVNIEGMKFLKSAKVIIEATCAGNSYVKRFEDVGTIGDFKDDIIRFSNDLSPFRACRYRFVIKIVDVREEVGKILGYGEIGTREKGGSFIYLQKQALEDQIWTTEWHDACGMAIIVNERCPGLYEQLENNPAIKALILPEVFRSFLLHALDNIEEVKEGDASNSMVKSGLDYAQKLLPDEDVPLDGKENADAKNEWIDRVVMAFCREHRLIDMYNRGFDNKDSE